MKKYLIFLIAIVGIALIILVSVSRSPAEDELPMEHGGGIPESIVAYATSGESGVIYNGAVFLERIIVGLDEQTASLSLTDSGSSASLSAGVFFQIEGNSLQGVYEIGTRLHTGIFLTTSANNVSIIYIPM